MAPVPGSMVNPSGRPVADQDRVSPSGSEPEIAREMMSPSEDDWAPGLATAGGRFTSTTVQVKVTSSNRFGDPSSVARTVTE